MQGIGPDSGSRQFVFRDMGIMQYAASTNRHHVLSRDQQGIDFEIPDEAKAIREKVRQWVHDECIPAEKELDEKPLDEVLRATPLLTKSDVRATLPKQWVPASIDAKAALASGDIELVETSGSTAERLRILIQRSKALQKAVRRLDATMHAAPVRVTAGNPVERQLGLLHLPVGENPTTAEFLDALRGAHDVARVHRAVDDEGEIPLDRLERGKLQNRPRSRCARHVVVTCRLCKGIRLEPLA